MKVAVIGLGNVGSAIARAATSTGHDVVVADPGTEKLTEVAGRLGVPTAASNREAVRDADVAVLALPFEAAKEVAGEIASEARGKVVVDVTNPLTADYSGLVTEGGPSAAEAVQERLPEARVVKAFNTVFAANQDKGEVDGEQLDGFVAGDDADAKQQVMSWLQQIGFRPVDVGPLSMARHLEGMAFLNISLNATNGWSWRSGWKLVGPMG